MKQKTNTKQTTNCMVMSFMLNEKSSIYSISKTVRSVIEAIPMGEGSVRFNITTSSKVKTTTFSISSSNVRGQFFELVKPDVIESALLKGGRIELLINRKAA
jgi:hypothetical protein